MYTSLEFSKRLKERGVDLQPKHKNNRDYDCFCWWKVYKGAGKNNYKMELVESSYETSCNEDYDRDPERICPAYDILYDICVRYAKKFFREEEVCINCGSKNIETSVKKFNECCNCYEAKRSDEDGFFIITISSYKYHTQKILEMLQQNKPQEEIEKYIEENSVFFKNDKEKR